jgi:hypothetical protein
MKFCICVERSTKSGTIHNTQTMESVYVPINWQIGKEKCMMYMYI